MKMKQDTEYFDLTIHALMLKKKELLNELLRRSIRSVISQDSNIRESRSRGDILKDLELTQNNLDEWGQTCGIDPAHQEKALTVDIRKLLEAIQENNNQMIYRIEQDRKRLEAERLNLEQGNKLSGYINQRGTYQRMKQYPTIQGKKYTGQSILRGTL